VNIIILINIISHKMFKKLVVVDAKGHLLGRLASYIAKSLLSGTSLTIQDKELQLSGAKVLTSPALSSETKSNSQSSSEKDSLPTPEEHLFIIVLPHAFSGGLSEACSLIKVPKVPLLSAD
jgi:hypothetical protein